MKLEEEEAGGHTHRHTHICVHVCICCCVILECFMNTLQVIGCTMTAVWIMTHTEGEFLYPFQKENSPPPTHPIAKAAPQSSKIRHGLVEANSEGKG